MQGIAVLILSGIVVIGGNDLPEGFILQGCHGDQIHIIGSGVMVVVMHAAGVDKVGIDRSEFRGLFIHHLGEVVQAAVAHIVAEHHGGFVARGEQRRIEQFSGGEGLAPENACQRSAGAAQGILDVELELDLRCVQIRDIFQRQQGGHNFGGGRRIDLFIGVLFIDHLAGIQIDEINRFGIHIEARIIIGKGWCDGRNSGDYNSQQQTGDSFEFTHPFDIPFPRLNEYDIMTGMQS